MIRNTKNSDFVPYAEDDPVWNMPLDFHDCLAIIAAVVDRARKDENGQAPKMNTEEELTHKYYTESSAGLQTDLDILEQWGYGREWFFRGLNKDDRKNNSDVKEWGLLFGGGLND